VLGVAGSNPVIPTGWIEAVFDLYPFCDSKNLDEKFTPTLRGIQSSRQLKDQIASKSLIIVDNQAFVFFAASK